MGAPAIAVSLCGDTHFHTAAQVVKEVVLSDKEHPLPRNRLLNINVPDCPLEALEGGKSPVLVHVTVLKT